MPIGNLFAILLLTVAAVSAAVPCRENFREAVFPVPDIETPPQYQIILAPVPGERVQLRNGRSEGFERLTKTLALPSRVLPGGGWIAALNTSGGGTMNWSILYVFACDGADLRLVQAFVTGTRSDEGLAEISVKGANLVIDV